MTALILIGLAMKKLKHVVAITRVLSKRKRQKKTKKHTTEKTEDQVKLSCRCENCSTMRCKCRKQGSPCGPKCKCNKSIDGCKNRQQSVTQPQKEETQEQADGVNEKNRKDSEDESDEDESEDDESDNDESDNDESDEVKDRSDKDQTDKKISDSNMSYTILIVQRLGLIIFVLYFFSMPHTPIMYALYYSFMCT